MDLTSSSHLTWGRFLNRFRSIPTSLWPPPAKLSAPCTCSEPWVHFRENFTKAVKRCFLKANALHSFVTVMPMKKKGSLGRKTVKSKAVEHTRAAEAPDEKRARLQADQVRHSLARAAETPEQYQVRLQSQQVRQNAPRAAETPIQHVSNVVLNKGWTPTFKVQGQVYHHAGPLHPANAEDSKYLQIYFLEKMSKCKDDWICLTVLLTETLFSNCKECCISKQLPVHDQPELTSKDVLRETSYGVQAFRAYMAANVPRLTPDQQQIFIAITRMIGSERGGIVFLDAPGGTDKTFLLNLLLAFVMKEKDMAVAVASSGIAATLLAGGRTARSAFKLPLDLARSDSATCNISKGIEQGHVLKTCKLIVWDEATMSHINAFHALDKTLKDWRGSSAIMGRATVVLTCDF
ncbi:ATP-dependent DNA helicase [Trichonephila inaurata madagascariensis]|uniref:ATP-dependent DNA helicase n=1 Tax=Trichonephila inaurata madagascariensis TaxID=2747483 RepID=A0A8X6XWE4_9ARAC|nr:ATP-dependent DNA helicase [Trichonephila inaurata madagascariensis]